VARGRGPAPEELRGAELGFARATAIDMRRTLEIFPLRLGTVREYAQRVAGCD